MAKKTGLGRGLDALFSDTIKEPEIEEVTGEIVQNIKITKIEPDKEQPRKRFDEEKLDELANSIKQYGVIQPIIVTLKDDYYQIIAGERRWRAAKKAGLTEIPCLVRTKTEQENREIALIENIQREDLNPIEEAEAYEQLIKEYNLRQDEVAEKVSKSRVAITNSLRLLKLDERVRRMVIEEKLKSGHARTLIPIEDGDLQYEIAQKIFDENLSVRETEKLVKKIQNNKDIPVEKKKVSDPAMEAIYHDLEEKMKSILGTKVAINKKDDQKGKIEIEYYSMDELDRIIDLIRTIA